MILDQIWDELHRIALLGANRTVMSTELQEALAQLGVSVDDRPSLTVLEAIASLRVLKKASMPLVQGREWPTSDLAEDDLVVINTRSIYHLQLILGGEFAPALTEFVSLVKKYQKLLPPEQLPTLLERCREEPGLFSSVAPLLGKRGQWLLEQNPEWTKLATSKSPMSPMKFRQELETEWDNLSAKEQVQQLNKLAPIIDSQDQPLLEKALTSSRKQVREAAAILLVQLPKANLAQQLFDQVSAYWLIEKGRSQLKLPKEIDASSFQLGIPTKAHKQYGGLKLSWFCHHLERIPPELWTAHFQQRPGALLQLIGKTREAKAMIYALLAASLLHKDQDWQKALLHFFLQSNQAPFWNHDRGKRLLKEASIEVSKELDLRGFSQELPNPAAYFILHNPHPWSKDTSRRIMDEFRQAASRPSGLTNLRDHFEAAAYKVWPELLPQLKEGWPRVDNVTTYNFTWALQKFLRIVTFRREMSTALTK